MDKTKPKFKHSPSLFTRIFTKTELNLPDGWASYNCTKEDQRTILLSQLTIFNHQPIMLRQIILQEDLTLKYFIGKHQVEVNEINTINNVYLPTAIKMEADIQSIIATFSSVNICNGAPAPLVKGNPSNEINILVYDSEMNTWRHKDCTYWNVSHCLEGKGNNCAKCYFS